MTEMSDEEALCWARVYASCSVGRLGIRLQDFIESPERELGGTVHPEWWVERYKLSASCLAKTVMPADAFDGVDTAAGRRRGDAAHAHHDQRVRAFQGGGRADD